MAFFNVPYMGISFLKSYSKSLNFPSLHFFLLFFQCGTPSLLGGKPTDLLAGLGHDLLAGAGSAAFAASRPPLLLALLPTPPIDGRTGSGRGENMAH